MKSSLDGSRDCMPACFSGISVIFFSHLFIGYAESLLHLGFLCLWRLGATHCCGVWASVAALVGEHRLKACRLQQPWLLHSMWNLPRPGIEPVPLVLAVLCCALLLGCVRLFAAPWNVACQAPSSLAGGLLVTILS